MTEYTRIIERLVRLRLMTHTVATTVKIDGALARTIGHSDYRSDANRIRLELTAARIAEALEAARDTFNPLSDEVLEGVCNQDDLHELISVITQGLMKAQRILAEAAGDLAEETNFSAITYEAARAYVLAGIALKIFACTPVTGTRNPILEPRPHVKKPPTGVEVAKVAQ